MHTIRRVPRGGSKPVGAESEGSPRRLGVRFVSVTRVAMVLLPVGFAISYSGTTHCSHQGDGRSQTPAPEVKPWLKPDPGVTGCPRARASPADRESPPGVILISAPRCRSTILAAAQPRSRRVVYVLASDAGWHYAVLARGATEAVRDGRPIARQAGRACSLPDAPGTRRCVTSAYSGGEGDLLRHGGGI